MEWSLSRHWPVILFLRDLVCLSQMPSVSPPMAARHHYSSQNMDSCLTDSLSRTNFYSPKIKLSLLSPYVCSLEVLFKEKDCPLLKASIHCIPPKPKIFEPGKVLRMLPFNRLNSLLVLELVPGLSGQMATLPTFYLFRSCKSKKPFWLKPDGSLAFIILSKDSKSELS